MKCCFGGDSFNFLFAHYKKVLQTCETGNPFPLQNRCVHAHVCVYTHKHTLTPTSRRAHLMNFVTQ